MDMEWQKIQNGQIPEKNKIILARGRNKDILISLAIPPGEQHQWQYSLGFNSCTAPVFNFRVTLMSPKRTLQMCEMLEYIDVGFDVEEWTELPWN